MNRRNLLEELNSGYLTNEDALAIVDQVIDSCDAEYVQDLLGFSRKEWTAYAQGAELSAVSKWRYEGWPRRCHRCGEEIDATKFGWLVISEKGSFFIKHVKCPLTDQSSKGRG